MNLTPLQRDMLLSAGPRAAQVELLRMYAAQRAPQRASVRPAGSPEIATATPAPAASPLSAVWTLLSVVGTAVGAYHGYKRNQSIGWGIWWAICGGVAPVITVPIALAQGVGEKK